jgi:membrane-associated phospholipid phosphatase
MRQLQSTWPLGLNRRTALWFVAGFIVVIAALHLLDHPLALWADSLPSDVRRVFRWITRWGESDWILIPSLLGVVIGWLLSLVTRDRLRQWCRQVLTVSSFIFLGVGLPSLVATLLKRIIGRARPMEWTPEAPLSFTPLNWDAFTYQAFPSGHTTTAFSLALTIAFLWPRSLWPMLGLALLIALSRVALGQHYITDVTAGAVLGTLGAFAVRNLFVSRGWLFDRAEGGEIVRRPLRPTR